MTVEGYERAKKWADYYADEGLIEGHPRGNLTAYTNYCYQIADQSLKSYVLKNGAINKGYLWGSRPLR